MSGAGAGAGADGVQTSAADVHMTSGFWFEEETTPELSIRMKLNSISFDAKSDFQRVQIIETGPFGKTLVLDGKTQSALNDEYAYHEALVQPALLTHPNPKTVFIGGGGEMATAREVLRHKSVEKCIVVDIDEVVCKMCREQMPEWNAGVYEDPRFEAYYMDAKKYIEDYDGKFDVIIMDIADPIEAGPGIALYTQEFYKTAITKLNPGGVFVTQSGPGSAMNITECCSVIHKTLASAFDHVLVYAVDVPSFACDWGFNIAFNKDHPYAIAAAEKSEDLLSHLLTLPTKTIDDTIASRLTSELRFMDGYSFKGLFATSKQLRKQVAEEERIMTAANPVFMY